MAVTVRIAVRIKDIVDVDDDDLRDELLRAIHGNGAFRCFKDTVHRYEIEEDWYAFRDDALREIAIKWCKPKRIDWK